VRLSRFVTHTAPPPVLTLSGPLPTGIRATIRRVLGSRRTSSCRQAAARGDSRLAGRFTLVLRRDGTYTDSNPLDGRDNGRLGDLGRDRLRFYADRGCKVGGLERPQGGIYRWSLNGRRLTLDLVNEGGCTGRTDTLTFPVWIRR